MIPALLQASDWFKATRADSAKCKKMIEAYEKEYVQWAAKGKKGKITWAMVTYMQTAEASTSVAFAGTAKMMWEREAIEYWQSVPGGASTEEEARSIPSARMLLS